MLTELKTRLIGKSVLILGVGNSLRGDDALGPLFVEYLKGKVNNPLIDAGDVPENYLGPIEASNADLVLIVDAADLGSNIGDAALFDIDQVNSCNLSTHTSNLGLIFKAIPHEHRPEVLVLGIQPGGREFNQGVSEPVRKTLESLAEGLIPILIEHTRSNL